jgi:hypothetical protein
MIYGDPSSRDLSVSIPASRSMPPWSDRLAHLQERFTVTPTFYRARAQYIIHHPGMLAAMIDESGLSPDEIVARVVALGASAGRFTAENPKPDSAEPAPFFDLERLALAREGDYGLTTTETCAVYRVLLEAIGEQLSIPRVHGSDPSPFARELAALRVPRTLSFGTNASAAALAAAAGR